MTSRWQEEKVGMGGSVGRLWTGQLTLVRKWGALGCGTVEGGGEGCCLDVWRWMEGGKGGSNQPPPPTLAEAAPSLP